MRNSEESRSNGALKEHLMFVALLLPTFVVVAAAAVSLVHADNPGTVLPADALAACERCLWETPDDVP